MYGSLGGAAVIADVNGDGYDDIVSTFIQQGSLGKLVIVYGGPDAPPGTYPELLAAFAGYEEDGPWPGAAFGASLAAGDINGDGLADVVVGAPLRAQGGAAIVVLGRDTGGVITHRGDAGEDAFTGTAGGEVMVGGAGNDLLVGGGGPDALSGGAGADIIEIGDADFRRVDGGSGDDTLRSVGGLTIDLTLAGSRIRGVERIDLSPGAGDLLVVDAPRIHRIAGSRRTLVVLGTGADEVQALGSGWALNGSVQRNQLVFERYTDGPVTLLVQSGVVVRIAPSIATGGLTLLEVAQPGDAVGQIAASDPDGALALWALTDPSGTLTIDQNGVARVAAGAVIDFEAQPTFDVTVGVTDDQGLTTERVVRVDVSNVDEPPVFAADAPVAFTVQEAVEVDRVLHRYTATDPEGLEPTYSLVDPSGALSVDPDGSLKIVNGPALDFERAQTVDLVLEASDPAGNTAQLPIRITVTDLQTLTTTIQHTYRSTSSLYGGPAHQRLDFPLQGPMLTGNNQDKGATLGALRATARTSGTAGIFYDGYYTTGGLVLDWPVAVSLTIPDNIRAGQPARITSTLQLREGAAISGRLPYYAFRMWSELVNFSYSVTICLGRCSTVGGQPITARLFNRYFSNFPTAVTGTASADRRQLSGGPWTVTYLDETINWDDYISIALRAIGLPVTIIPGPARPAANARNRSAPSVNLVGNRQVLEFGVGTATATIVGLDMLGKVQQEFQIDATFNGLTGILTLEDGSIVEFPIGGPVDVNIPANGDANGDGRVEADLAIRLDATAVNNRRWIITQGWRWMAGHVVFDPLDPRLANQEMPALIDLEATTTAPLTDPARWNVVAPTKQLKLPLQLSP